MQACLLPSQKTRVMAATLRRTTTGRERAWSRTFENRNVILSLRRLELLVAIDNVASRRVAEKIGATFEGVLPAGPHGQGSLEHASYCYALDR